MTRKRPRSRHPEATAFRRFVFLVPQFGPPPLPAPPVDGGTRHGDPHGSTRGPGEAASARRWERSPGRGDRCADPGAATGSLPPSPRSPPHSGFHFPGEHGVDLEGDKDRVPGERGLGRGHRGTATERGPHRAGRGAEPGRRGGPETKLRSPRTLLVGRPVAPERGEVGCHGARPPPPNSRPRVRSIRGPGESSI